MANYGHVIFYSLLGGIFSLIGGLILLGNRRLASGLAKYATPFAGGALLGAAFLDLLKEGVEIGPVDSVLLAALIGTVLFFLAEGFLQWFHHHHDHHSDTDPKIWLIVAGDTLHNALDGVAIAASFLVSVPAGIVTTLAVATHEIPQEIGDFGLLLSKGMRRRSVLLVSLASALATTFAAVLTFWIGSQEKLPIGVLLGLSAGFLLYIATSDIIPTIHAKQSRRLFDIQALLLVAGVVVVGVATNLAHQYIDVDTHTNESSSQTEQH